MNTDNKCKFCNKEIHSGYWCSIECKKKYLEGEALIKKESNFLKTIFTPLIETIRKHNRKKSLLNEIKYEAEIEAIMSMRDNLVEINKQKMLSKMSQNKGEQLKNMFKLNINTDKVLNDNFKHKNEKYHNTDKILGFASNNENNENSKVLSNQRIVDMMRLKR